MNNRVFLLLFFLIWGNIALCQTYSVSIISQQPISAVPGEISTVVLKIHNNDTASIDIKADFIKQENVSCIMCKQVIHVEPKSEKDRKSVV